MTASNKKHRQLFSQSLMTFLAYGARFILRFFKNALISRFIGPTNRGVLSMIVLIPTLLTTIGNMGFGQAVVFYVAKKGVDLPKVMGTAAVFISGASVILGLICWGALQFPAIFGESYDRIMHYGIMVVFAIPLILLHRIGLQLIMAKNYIKAYNSIGIIDSFIPLALFFILIMFGVAPFSAAVLSWFLGLAACALMPPLLVISNKTLPLTYDWLFFKKSMRYGITSHAANMFQIILFRIDYFFISVMLGATDLGYYAITTAIAELLFVLPEAIGVPFVPILFGSARKEGDKMVPLVVKVTFILMIVGCAGIIVLGKPVLNQFFGQDFLPAYPPLLYLLPGILCISLFTIFKADLFSRKLQGHVSLMAGGAVVVNLILNFILIPTMGINGAALSSSISYAILTGLCFYTHSRLSGNTFFKTFFFTRGEWVTIKQKFDWYRKNR